MSKKGLTTGSGAPVVDNNNVITAGPRGPMLLQDVWFLEKLAHFDREVIPERRMHAKGSGAYGKLTVTHDISRYTRAKMFAEVGKTTDLFLRFSTVAGERGAADAERDIRGFAIKFYTEEGNWDLVGNNTPVFLSSRPAEIPGPEPRSEARSAHQPAQPYLEVGFFLPAARNAASVDYRLQRPRHPALLSPYARLRQPRVQLYKCRQSTFLGEIPL